MPLVFSSLVAFQREQCWLAGNPWCCISRIDNLLDLFAIHQPHYHKLTELAQAYNTCIIFKFSSKNPISTTVRPFHASLLTFFFRMKSAQTINHSKICDTCQYKKSTVVFYHTWCYLYIPFFPKLFLKSATIVSFKIHFGRRGLHLVKKIKKCSNDHDWNKRDHGWFRFRLKVVFLFEITNWINCV